MRPLMQVVGCECSIAEEKADDSGDAEGRKKLCGQERQHSSQRGEIDWHKRASLFDNGTQQQAEQSAANQHSNLQEVQDGIQIASDFLFHWLISLHFKSVLQDAFISC